MVTKRSNIQENISARRQEARIDAQKQILNLLEDHYATEMVRMLETARHFSGSDFRRFRDLINDEFITPYHSKKYGLADFLKKSIENWLHARHAIGEISLSFIDHYVGTPVVVNRVLEGDDASNIPWGPKHEVGEIIWGNTLMFLGSINSSDEQCVLSQGIRTKEDFKNYMNDIRKGKLEILDCFNITPGDLLNFEV